MLLLLVVATAYAQDTVIYFAPGTSYMPSEPTATNPDPPTAINTLVDEYEAAHPGVSIELVPVPENVSTDTWRVTSFQGGNEPHIISNNYVRVWQEAVNDWYVPLNDYIAQPNPYTPAGVPGSEHWKDSIDDDIWDTTLAADGSQYLVTVDAVAVGFFFNKEIFEEVGLGTDFVSDTSIWENWADMMSDMAKLEEAGYDPLAMTMNTATPYSYNWIDGIVLTSLYYDEIPQMMKPGSEWHALNQEEFGCAVQNGLVSASDPEYSAFADIMQAFEPYWVEGYTSNTEDEAYRLFINGQSPILLVIAAEYMERALRDADFDFGVTYFAPLDGETSPEAEGVDTAFLLGGPTAGYVVTERAEREGITDQVVDFLQFITAQPQWSRVVSDAPRSVPTLKGLDVPEALGPITSFLQLPIRAFKDSDPRVSKRYGEEHRRMMQEFFNGTRSKEALLADEGQLLEREVQKLVAANGWTCDFQAQ